jgi:hypothetical protein
LPTHPSFSHYHDLLQSSKNFEAPTLISEPEDLRYELRYHLSTTRVPYHLKTHVTTLNGVPPLTSLDHG